ncbi:uncharacterized protein LOC121632231 [Melanotaenia boesemani]|uniref:uncharacterized protein LOC121632231 n=1 Tax=Melanotaenia boesemani TaxID=1250792 RepID=UPI001C04BC7D|nr:uncharacterized protein LOC121632231 [Melanotaenia boesemani]
MILYLVLHALILSIVASQSANITEELSEVDLNQTSRLFTDYKRTPKPKNVTSSLYKNEMDEIEKELQGNQTSSVITEDDERFQDQETKLPDKHCHRNLLVEFSDVYCGDTFHKEMQAISTDNWCTLAYFIRPYNDLTICLEELTKVTGCYFPNPDIQDYFLSIHSTYFQNCTKEEDEPEDAPHSVVVMLTIIPVGLLPIVVCLVVWRS